MKEAYWHLFFTGPLARPILNRYNLYKTPESIFLFRCIALILFLIFILSFVYETKFNRSLFLIWLNTFLEATLTSIFTSFLVFLIEGYRYRFSDTWFATMLSPDRVWLYMNLLKSIVTIKAVYDLLSTALIASSNLLKQATHLCFRLKDKLLRPRLKSGYHRLEWRCVSHHCAEFFERFQVIFLLWKVLCRDIADLRSKVLWQTSIWRLQEFWFS